MKKTQKIVFILNKKIYFLEAKSEIENASSQLKSKNPIKADIKESQLPQTKKTSTESVPSFAHSLSCCQFTSPQEKQHTYTNLKT